MQTISPIALLAVALLTGCGMFQKVIPTGYKGRGADSISQEMVQKHSPRPHTSALAGRIQSLMDLRSPSLGIISENGKALYFSWSVTGVNQVWKLDGPQRWPEQLTGGPDSTFINDVLRDGRYAIVSRDNQGDEQYGLFLIKVRGGEFIPVFNEKGQRAYYEFASDDSRRIYFRANDKDPSRFTLYRFSINTGEKTEIFDNEGYWSVADHIGETQLLLEKRTGSRSNEFYDYNIQTKKLTPILGQGKNELYKLQYANDSGYVVLTNEFGEYKRLYHFEGNVFKPISPNVEYDIVWFDVDSQRKRIVFENLRDGRVRLGAYSLPKFESLSLPDFGNAVHVWAGATTRNGRYTAIGIQTHNQPTTSYVYDWSTGRKKEWWKASTPEVGTENFEAASLEYFDATDGEKIPMFVWRKDECKDRACPVIVDYHGGPASMSRPGFKPLIQIFLEQNYVYVQPNVRGSSGYGKSWQRADDKGNRWKALEDVADCAKFISSKWKVRGKSPKVGVVGGSYGGYTALMAMTYHAGLYDAGVAIAAISDLETFLQNTAPYRRALRESEYGYLETDREMLKKLSPVTYIEKAQDPLLLIHGINDTRVPVGEATQVYKSLQKKIPVELILLPDEGHQISKRQNKAAVLAEIIEFFNKHLKSGS